MNNKQKRTAARIAAAAALLAVLHFCPVTGALRLALYMVPYLIVGWDILGKAVHGVLNRQPFDENFLMAVATVGAIALGDYVEGVAVMLFYQIGELFQSVAVGKSRRSIGALMDIRPDFANLEREDGQTERVDPDDVAPGSVIVVRPGERIPIDGVVVQGRASLQTAAMTGESLPDEVSEGDEVVSGCVDLSGVLRIRTTRAFGESTVARILDLVENASSRKARSEQFITRFARVYTPAVCFGALALAILPPLVRLMSGMNALWSEYVMRALTFLVISCPCALVVSIPLGFFAGIGGASTAGVLVKGSNDLETLSRVRTVVFDKTGTLTQGVFDVVQIAAQGMEEAKVLELAALCESYSNHPIAASILAAYGEKVDLTRVRDVREIGGNGVSACVDGRAVAVGNARMMEHMGIRYVPCEGEGTAVYVAADGCFAGSIRIADRVKPTAAQAIAALRRAGVRRTVMLTGDRQQAAEQVARELGIDETHAQLLPQDKVARVEALLGAQGRREKLAFVGDGINDAPVLARADVGIAMGGVGSDAAIEAADIVLMDDDPLKIAKAMRIARRCMRIVYENIAFAIGIKVVCLVLGALGIAGMWTAVFADVGVLVLAVLNAVRALDTRRC